MKKIIITFISLIIGILSRAQTVNEHYYFKNLSSQNGLSQNTVSAILQDSKGFMWFGTKDGLDRYDGVSFRHFKYDRNNPRSLGNNFVTSLYEDIEGNIWVGTDVGVYIYYPEKDTFRHFVEQSDKNTRVERAVAMISGDSQGRVWIAAEAQNLFCYDLKKQTLRKSMERTVPAQLVSRVLQTTLPESTNMTMQISLLPLEEQRSSETMLTTTAAR